MCSVRDKKKTLAQNFRRLGLSAHLNAPTGGIENTTLSKELPVDPLHITGPTSKKVEQSQAAEVTVERDPKTGKILRVVRPEEEKVEIAGKLRRKTNPLDDPVEDALRAPLSKSAATSDHKSAVVKALEEQAQKQSETMQMKRQPRHQSAREVEWLSRLIAKHGDNVTAMARDMKLNPMQQAPADIRRRLEMYKQTQNQQ